jgi:hypothetical protein
VEWVKKWLILRDRLVEIAKVLRKFPWMVDVVRQRPMSILHPYTVEVYVARDGSEACLSLNPPTAFCARDGAVMWGLVELDKLAYAASLTPFIPAGVRKHPREEAFKVLREAPDPYEKFKEIANAAIAKNEKLAEPWESLRVLIMPKPSEE